VKLDDFFESGADVSLSLGEKPASVRVSVDGSSILEAKLLGNSLGPGPIATQHTGFGEVVLHAWGGAAFWTGVPTKVPIKG
jgi:hypothetical protein